MHILLYVSSHQEKKGIPQVLAKPVQIVKGNDIIYKKCRQQIE